MTGRGRGAILARILAEAEPGAQGLVTCAGCHEWRSRGVLRPSVVHKLNWPSWVPACRHCAVILNRRAVTDTQS